MEQKNEVIEIKRAFDDFVKAWETGEVELIDRCMIPDPIADFSLFSITYSRQALKIALRDSFAENTRRVFETHNFACRVSGEKARLSAALAGLVYTDADEGFRRYAFAGQFACEAIKLECGWRLSAARFDLLDDDCVSCAEGGGVPPTRREGNGDFSLVRGWNPIRPNVQATAERVIPRVCAELHSPWALKDGAQVRGEDAVRELFYRFAFALDCNDSALLADILAPDARVTMEGLADADRAETLRALKNYQLRMGGRYLHAVDFKALEIGENKAAAKVFCKSPGHLLPLEISSERQFNKLYSAKYEFAARKTDSGWQLTQINYLGGAFIGE